MCNIKPLRVKKIIGNTAFLEGGMRAIYDKRVGVVKADDKVMVFGNLIIKRMDGIPSKKI